jgi:hypothetical protein
MVDKLRKFGEVLWLNKERLILVAMVAVLCFQVYKVLNPEVKAAGEVTMPPTDDVSGLDPQPALPPDKPRLTISGDYVSLFRRNPFWYFSGKKQGNTTSNTEEVGIQLVDIQDTGTRQRARLRTATTTKWYDINEPFEQYKLISVDVSGQSAVVYVESLGREITLQREQ